MKRAWESFKSWCSDYWGVLVFIFFMGWFGWGIIWVAQNPVNRHTRAEHTLHKSLHESDRLHYHIIVPADSIETMNH